MKSCSKCKTAQLLTEFNKDKTRKDGLFPQCKSCCKIYNQSEEGKAKFRRYYTSDKGHATKRTYKKTPAQLAKNNALEMKRYATKVKATPPWLTKDHLDLIEMYYQLSHYLTRETGIKHEVDHIIPIMGENVMGLHVPWNLRVIPKQENQYKNNRIL